MEYCRVSSGGVGGTANREAPKLSSGWRSEEVSRRIPFSRRGQREIRKTCPRIFEAPLFMKFKN